jgi:uncharacterized BrkB/YihY/UPF0761 family membrane protein
MISEIDQLPSGVSGTGWALGCIVVSYAERIRSMIRVTNTVSPWIFGLELLVCFVPLTWLFGASLESIAHGFPGPTGALYASTALAGPVGLAITFWSVLHRNRKLNRAAIGALGVLAGWTLLAYSFAITQRWNFVATWSWRDYVLLGLLPVFAAIHLARRQAYLLSSVGN